MVFSRLLKLSQWVGVALLFATTIANALIFYSTSDPAYNTNAPSGVLTNSGWQFQGKWGGFLGTPIAPRFFITASHVGGSIGDSFTFNGISYFAEAFFDDPQTDLRVWRICGTFPAFALCYTNHNELGKDGVVFGRGNVRGAEVMVTNSLTSELKGWTWGPYDGAQRFGENRISGIVNGDDQPGVTGIGEMLAASFDATGGANECTLASGDSGGGVFIQEDSVWKLAGISYAVDGPFSLTDSGAAFNAAVFDVGGLYALENATFVLIVDNAADQPGSFYSTRISSRMDWIRSVVASPQPPDLAPTLQAATGPDGPYTDFSDATVDEASGTITLTPPVSREAQFYRLRTCAPLRITSVQVLGGHVVLKYGVAMGEVFAHP